MAVPGRRNGLMEEDDDNDEAVFGELIEDEVETPAHLRNLAVAAQLGDVDALRLALGLLFFFFFFLFPFSFPNSCDAFLMLFVEIIWIKP